MASLVQNNNENSLTSPEQKCTGEFDALEGDKSPSLPGTTNRGLWNVYHGSHRAGKFWEFCVSKSLVMAFSKSSLPLLLDPFINYFIMICESMLSVSQNGLLREMFSLLKYRYRYLIIYTYDFNSSSFDINCFFWWRVGGGAKIIPLIKHWVGGPLPPASYAPCGH
jgi:hypothetical protein